MSGSDFTPVSAHSATLTIAAIEGEARIRDLDLAARLGFERPRKIRDLIKRYQADLLRLGACPTVGRVINGGEATEFYLNRKQAIFITAKSETAEATDITIEIIEKFDAYERGLIDAESEERARRADGIARMLSRKVTGLEKTVAELADALQTLTKGVSTLTLASDGRVAALDLISVRQLMDEARAESKGRNSLNGRVRHALLALALKEGVKGIRRCPHSNHWLFPIDFAREWMATTGNAWVAAHNASLAPQGDLFAGQSAKRPPKPANDRHPAAANGNAKPRKDRGAA